jgi:hypothetical protein
MNQSSFFMSLNGMYGGYKGMIQSALQMNYDTHNNLPLKTLQAAWVSVPFPFDTIGEFKTTGCHIKHTLPLHPTFSHFTQ